MLLADIFRAGLPWILLRNGKGRGEGLYEQRLSNDMETVWGNRTLGEPKSALGWREKMVFEAHSDDI